MGRNGAGSRFTGRAAIAGALALVLGGILALSAEARGWGRDGRGPAPDRQAARLAERLGLSAEQETRVREIFAESGEKRRAIREEGWKKMEGLRAETEERLAGVLTPEQMTGLRDLRERRMERRRDCGPRAGGWGGGFRGGPPTDRD